MKDCITKRISLILAALLLALSAVSCSEAPSETESESPVINAQDSETVPEETEYVEPLEIEVEDYEGHTINIVLTGNWEYDDFIEEGMMGEVINDAKFTTKAAVSDLLNVEFSVNNQSGQTSDGSGTGYKLINMMVMSGTDDYDIAEIGCYDVSTLANTGRLLDLNTINNIDLSKSWWDPQANEQLSIAGKMFYSTGDASLLDNRCTYCILFNKQLIGNYNLDSPYDLVREGKWLYDKFVEMSEVAGNDLNGDGITDTDDSFGILVWQDSVIGMLHASGGKFADINDEGMLEISINSERNFDVLTSWLTLRSQPGVLFMTDKNDDDAHAAFIDNRILFYTRYLDATSWFRDAEVDFGIVPYPKWDENQTDFFSTMHAWGTSYFCFPITLKDPEMSGAVLEALSYYGKQNITPAYYETTLKGKYFRDEESGEMLDLIFSSRFFDVGVFYKLGAYGDKLISMMQSGKTDFVSTYEKTLKAATKVLDQINEAFDATLSGETP